MQTESVFAGFGGQGCLQWSAAGVRRKDEGREVTGSPPTVRRCAAVRRTAQW
jgi:hypothetical protein